MSQITKKESGSVHSKVERSKIKKAYYFISKALTETGRDFTNGRMKSAVLFLAIPMVLEMMMESAFAIVDIIVVGKISPEAVAVVTLTETVITIIYAIAVGMSITVTAMVSRRIGEKREKRAAHVAFQAILAGLAASFVIAIAGIFYSKEILGLMGATQSTIEAYSGYTSMMLMGNAVIMMLFIINAIFRSAGDATISLKVLFIANIINIILDPCLVFGWGPFPEMGITGAAVATNTGRGLAVVYQVYLLFRGNSRIKLVFSDLKADFAVMMKLFKLSIGSVGQMIIATTSWIGIVRIISVFGEHSVAGYGTAIRLIVVALLPALGISNATSTLVGQNLGAEKPERAEKAVWLTAKYNLIVLGIIGIIYVIMSETLIGFLNNDPEVISKGAMCLEIISYGFLAYGPGMILIHAFNGAGDTMTPTVLNLIFFWAIEIPLAYLLAIVLDWREQGVCYAIIIAETLLTLSLVYLFNKGKWKTNTV